MTEQGIVLAVRGEKALVRVSAKGGCEGCRACSTASGCTQELEAVTRQPVAPGSLVVVQVSSVGAAASALLLFVLPLVGLVGGVLVGHAWGAGTLAPLALGFGALLVLFGLAVLVERTVVRPRLPEPTIVEVLREGG